MSHEVSQNAGRRIPASPLLYWGDRASSKQREGIRNRYPTKSEASGGFFSMKLKHYDNDSRARFVTFLAGWLTRPAKARAAGPQHNRIFPNFH